MADLKLNRLLDRIDDWIEHSDLRSEVASPERFAATHAPDAPRLLVDLEATGIGTVLWATGFRPDYRWLRVPVFDRKGRLRHDGGIVDAPGLYALGLTFMRRRKSSFIHGTADDVRELGEHLVAYLRRSSSGMAPSVPAVSSATGPFRRYVDSTDLKSMFR